MKTFLIILFLLLSIIHNHDLVTLRDYYEEEEDICCDWLIDNKYYCSYFDDTIIIEKMSTKEDCTSKSTIKCSNLYYNTKEECEKSSQWIEGRCYNNDPENVHAFLPTYKSEAECLEEKADWTMQYCAFRTFKGAIYNQINKDSSSYDDSQFENICKNTLNGAYSKQGNEYPCFFAVSQKLNKYFCKIVFANIGEDEDCPLTMDSENCATLGGSEYGQCSHNTIFGEYKSDCLKINKHEWKTEEGFCYDHLEITDKTSCEAKKRGNWETVYGIVRDFPGECVNCRSQYLSFKIILLILSFIFII